VWAIRVLKASTTTSFIAQLINHQQQELQQLDLSDFQMADHSHRRGPKPDGAISMIKKHTRNSTDETVGQLVASPCITSAGSYQFVFIVHLYVVHAYGQEIVRDILAWQSRKVSRKFVACAIAFLYRAG
jgi:predicted PurR-regulated permease PerM